MICSCSGCTHEYNLHRPDIVDEATDFFEKLGVSDFTFDSCRLVNISLVAISILIIFSFREYQAIMCFLCSGAGDAVRNLLFVVHLLSP